MTSGVTCGVVFDTKVILTKEGASFHRNTLSESGVMKNVGAKCLELFINSESIIGRITGHQNKRGMGVLTF